MLVNTNVLVTVSDMNAPSTRIGAAMELIVMIVVVVVLIVSLFRLGKIWKR